jgi:dihydroxyacetone kinase-like predicted kinase
MNIFNYKLGELIINNKKISLTRTQSKILFVLLNNELNTYEEIYSYIYKTDVTEKLNRQMRQSIRTQISGMRKKGLKITAKYNFGFKLMDKLYIQ